MDPQRCGIAVPRRRLRPSRIVCASWNWRPVSYSFLATRRRYIYRKKKTPSSNYIESYGSVFDKIAVAAAVCIRFPSAQGSGWATSFSASFGTTPPCVCVRHPHTHGHHERIRPRGYKACGPNSESRLLARFQGGGATWMHVVSSSFLDDTLASKAGAAKKTVKGIKAQCKETSKGTD